MAILVREKQKRLLAVAIQENRRKPGESVGFIAEGGSRGKVVFITARRQLVAGEFAFADLSSPQNRGIDLTHGKAISGLHLFGQRTWGADLQQAREACEMAIETDRRRRAAREAREEELWEQYQNLVREGLGLLRSDLESRIVCEAPLEAPKQTVEQVILFPPSGGSFCFQLIRGRREAVTFVAADQLRPPRGAGSMDPALNWMVTGHRDDGVEVTIALRRALCSPQ